MRTPIVWIVKEQVARAGSGSVTMDFSPALEFGDLEFITVYDIPLYGKGVVMDQWNRDVRDFVQKYDPMHDFIVTTGQPLAIFMIGYELAKSGKRPRFLVWRREENRYRVVNIDPAPTLQAA